MTGSGGGSLSACITPSRQVEAVDMRCIERLSATGVQSAISESHIVFEPRRTQSFSRVIVISPAVPGKVVVLWRWSRRPWGTVTAHGFESGSWQPGGAMSFCCTSLRCFYCCSRRDVLRGGHCQRGREDASRERTHRRLAERTRGVAKAALVVWVAFAVRHRWAPRGHEQEGRERESTRWSQEMGTSADTPAAPDDPSQPHRVRK